MKTQQIMLAIIASITIGMMIPAASAVDSSPRDEVSSLRAQVVLLELDNTHCTLEIQGFNDGILTSQEYIDRMQSIIDANDLEISVLDADHYLNEELIKILEAENLDLEYRMNGFDAQIEISNEIILGLEFEIDTNLLEISELNAQIDTIRNQ